MLFFPSQLSTTLCVFFNYFVLKQITFEGNIFIFLGRKNETER